MPWTVADLIAEHGELYHVTFPENVERIERLGIVCSAKSKETIGSEAYRALTGADGIRRRPVPVGLGEDRVLLNDQLPMSRGALNRCKLPTVNAQGWIDYLDQHAFLWASPSRLATFLYARRQRGYESVVFRVTTVALLATLHEATRLSSQNSGAPDRQSSSRHFFIAVNGREKPAHWFNSKGQRRPVVEIAIHNECVPPTLLKRMPASEWMPLLDAVTIKRQKAKERARKQ